MFQTQFISVIAGHDKKGILSAKNRIEILVESGRQKQAFTHFLSIPIISKDVRHRFMDFKEDVLRFCDAVCLQMIRLM